MKKPDFYLCMILNQPHVSGLVRWNPEPKGDPEVMKKGFRGMALMPVQTHSLNVGLVTDRFQCFEDTDALVTFCEDIPIGVVTADCVPILIYCPDVRGIAAIHAGWKGTLGGIVDRTLDLLEEHGAKPEEMFVAFGPSISQKYYEVGKELGDQFVEAGFGDYVTTKEALGELNDSEESKEPNPHIDLQGVNMERLLRRGVKREHIELSNLCTFSTRDETGAFRFPSYRRDGIEAGRLLTAIMILRD